MNRFMSYEDNKWAKPLLFRLSAVTDTSPISRIYEADVRYSDHLHDIHSNLPLFIFNATLYTSKVTKLMTCVITQKREKMWVNENKK